MKSLFAKEKAKKLVLFSIALVAVMALVFLLASSLKDGADTNAVASAQIAAVSTEADMLINTNANLQQQLAALQQLDGQFATSITDTAFAIKADSLNKLILAEESRFKNAVEAAGEMGGNLPGGNSKANFDKMVAAYLLLLESRQSSGMLRNVATLNSSSLAPDEKQLLHLQNDLVEKSNRITSLEMTLMQMKNAKPVMLTENSNSNNAELLHQITALETKVDALNTLNSGLKQDNDRLQLMQNNMSKTATSAEQQSKEKNTSLQQRIDDLNAEILLVKVDCNLNRVDATQIISNAKQRRQLLNEASDMLTNLSVSGNAAINRKVKEKINRLNQVAGNYRE